jgi:uncharacterized protein YcbK (DUF882 family)
MMQHQLLRRRLLHLSAAGIALPTLLLPRKSTASGTRADVLAFVHTHTGERLSAPFRAAGALIPGGLSAIDRLLRDHRSGDIRPIDPGLLVQLHRIAQMTGTREPFQVISGFRSERTNELLRKRGGGGVARGSLHLQGRAIDIRLADVKLADLRDAALELRAGGVGYYPSSRFVHLDTGRVRSW